MSSEAFALANPNGKVASSVRLPDGRRNDLGAQPAFLSSGPTKLLT